VTQYITAAIVLGGKSLTPQAIAAAYQAYLQAQKDLDDARAVVAAKKAARDAALAGATAMTSPLRKYLAATYGEESPTYTAFGLPVTKKAAKTVQVKAAAATKASATRKSHKAALASAPTATHEPAPPATPPAKS
jgi:hypothetical protein